ncbi:threonine aldolase family protein [Pandoraea anhela]|uniref:Threonine aldolase n=1 Tax=Pandoraea anhela TaxID=2508295 RepID=A0A5E4WFE7_9BURK|nr:GntG family PLP-dependent aldolase [Pandoraea anhela]VVE21765.1 threonine aldolase [Pandoraea anhela]
MDIVDLRSDILARPTEAMISAMAEAARLPRQLGHREGRQIVAFEKLAAEVLGKEDALFFPTCTMANQVALMINCRAGSTVVADANAHLRIQESTSTIGVAGVIMHHPPTYLGHWVPEDLDAALASCQADLVWFENTHNRAGGTVMPPDVLRATVDVCRRHGVATHLDGARLWNAVVASKCRVTDLTDAVDSVAVSMNKCLGTPVGAVLAGTRDFIKAAEHFRIMLGGGWRPLGMLAAAGQVALENLPFDDIQADHDAATALASALASFPNIDINLRNVHTNIVMARIGDSPALARAMVNAMAEQGVRAMTAAPDTIRFVTYGGIRSDAIARTVDAFERAYDKVMPPTL